MIKSSAIHFSYSRQEPLFSGLSFEMGKGSITGLLGKNGAGKTTLLKLLAGLTFPHSGDIEVLSHTPAKRQPSFLQQLYFVPEEFYLPPISIQNYLKAHVPFYPVFDMETFDKVLREFELDKGKSLHKMSYGQKKKFLISFALACKCKLLILDEPTNGLDIPSKSIFRRVLASSVGEDQLVIISTHQVRDVENLIDRIMILEGGEFILEKEMIDISTQLEFGNSSSNEQALYAEAGPGGFKTITKSSRSNGSQVDLELLFNAVVSGTKLFDDVSE